MADIVDKLTRSRMMAGIRSKNTRPEKALRAALHARGLRYRLHAKNVPGHPDLALPRFNAAIFVHGCFWHRHEGCRYTTTPTSRVDFWQAKFAANVERDATVRNALSQAGWRVATVWECALGMPEHITKSSDMVISWLKSDAVLLEVGRADIEGTAESVRPTKNGSMPGLGGCGGD